MERLRHKERAILYGKVTDLIRKKLFYMLNLEAWQGTEIAEYYFFPSNRQSEIKNPGKYPNAKLGSRLLTKIIQGGFVTSKEILSSLDLNEKERAHIKDLFILTPT